MNYEPTELCILGYKYGTDKCPQIKHHYTPFYYELLKGRRNSIKKVLELGIGHYKGMQDNPIIYDRGLNIYYQRGASLKMWRDFFPNAQIYGADIRPEAIFTDKRIKTYLCDETKKEDLEKLIKNIGNDIDLVVDDASHHVYDQIFTCQTLMPLLKKDVLYVIEDVVHSRHIRKTISDKYNTYVAPIPRKWHGGMLMVITNKKNKILLP
jgi:hypothetical protein